MVYEIAHTIATKFKFLWRVIEWGNGSLFFITHCKRLKKLPDLLNSLTGEYKFRMAESNDAAALSQFFDKQPQESFKFFNPHKFDEISLAKILSNKAFLAFIVRKEDTIVGYFFLRCFIDGKCFRGKIVDSNWCGKGIATQIGIVTTKIAQSLDLRMFGTISPNNIGSLTSSKASNEVRILKTLKNGYYYIEYLPKE